MCYPIACKHVVAMVTSMSFTALKYWLFKNSLQNEFYEINRQLFVICKGKLSPLSIHALMEAVLLFKGAA